MNKLKENSTLAILLGNLFIAFLGIGLVIPILPTIMNELNISGKVVGNLTAAFALTQLFVSPFTGRAVDRYGRKIIVVIGLIIFGISELLFGMGKTVEILFLSRILGGVSAAFIMPAVTAFITDITTQESRPKAFGYMSAAISTGFIIGPGIGGFLAELGTRVPFYTAAVLGFVAAILSVLFLSEPARQRMVQHDSAANKKSGLKKMFIPMFLIAFIMIFVSSFGLAAFESFFSLFVDHKFNFTPKDIAISITGGAIIGAIVQVALFNRLTVKLGEIGLVRYCLIFSAVTVFLVTQANSYLTIMLLTFIVFVGFDLIRPAITNYLSNVAGDEQGFVAGMNSMFTSLANVMGPIVGGMLFDIDVDYPYYMAVILLIVGLFISMFWKQKATAQSLI
ncbi:multidrug efflux MFS transporter NorA [Paenibacillus sp. FSL W7-1287]|uniref:multidrug efflux MFS transporter NorA n=1 Tax=Paenibacillus sp. FSL W7-1287 TaxID=2954538 RepID=UPI0030F8F5E4